MGELGKMPEVTEMKTPAVEGFRDIKPESGMSVQEAKNFWDETFHAEKNQVRNGGGSYKEVRNYVKETGHENKEVHHMPADDVSPLDRMDGPCIEMTREDHRKTASCGNSMEAREYRAKQKELIDNGDFRGALQMDIDDIKEKFGNKYDAQIQEMLGYVDQLEQGGKI